MEVFCYGLSLPLTEHETVRACVDVYCEWLSALLPEPPKASVPQPVVQEANRFARKIIQHLFHLFVPRTNQCKKYNYLRVFRASKVIDVNVFFPSSRHNQPTSCSESPCVEKDTRRCSTVKNN